MSKQTALNKLFYSCAATDIEGFDSLADLTLDLRWSWDHGADEVWKMLDPSLWDLTRNPWLVLQTVSHDRFQSAMNDPVFRSKVDDLVKSSKLANSAPAWFQHNYPDSPLSCVAYFSMEFMLSEALPIYSGGLGNVAGDQLKAASDLGIPVVGIGLLYQQGYFRQVIDRNGVQEALYPYNDPGQLPVTPLRQSNGEWLRIKIDLPGYYVWLRVWQVQVGRVKLYLLDSNDAANFPVLRGITSELYGGGSELRLKQEMVLGLGGWRLLQALHIHPQVCHLNEGHAAFAILERAYDFMKDSGHSFDVALAVTRAGNLFTTHTAVPAGFDCFPPALMVHYMGDYARNKLCISPYELLALGRTNPGDMSENFNMAYLAIRGSGAVNGVSRLHGEVSRQIFEPLFPGWPPEEVPVGYVTNGVHMPTWDSKEADAVWTAACGKDRWLGMNKNLEKDMLKVSDEKLWEMRSSANKALIKFTRTQFSRQLISSGHPAESIEYARHVFDPNVLTIGFARRFAMYKRTNLLLSDPERLIRLLTNPMFPVQLIIAGKAHPADMEGQALIKEWIEFIVHNRIHLPIVFLSDYDMHVSEHLVYGVDLWINTPRRPWEACGTSGMKVLVNGGINLSELDGWWAEAYTPEVGWALGNGNDHINNPGWDTYEANQLYDLLENQVIPEFYNRNEKGIPVNWIARMRKSMAKLTPQFSADRAVREYTVKHYLPAAAAYMERAANNGAIGKRITDQLTTLDQKWNSISFGKVHFETIGKVHMFDVQVDFKDLDPDIVQIELFAIGKSGNGPVVQRMKRGTKIDETENSYHFFVSADASRPASDYTPRAVPLVPNISVPLEFSKILWQR